MAIRPSREQLAHMLREHGENDLAERASAFTDNEMARIGTLAAHYAWSEDAVALGSGMGGKRALALATLDVIEGSERDLRLHHSQMEVDCFEMSQTPDESERKADHLLRAQAADRQRPA